MNTWKNWIDATALAADDPDHERYTRTEVAEEIYAVLEEIALDNHLIKESITITLNGTDVVFWMDRLCEEAGKRPWGFPLRITKEGLPLWPKQTRRESFGFELSDPGTLTFYPPGTSGEVVEILYCASPLPMVSESDPIDPLIPPGTMDGVSVTAAGLLCLESRDQGTVVHALSQVERGDALTINERTYFARQTGAAFDDVRPG